ncbi:hypothetical protein K461DRAFT_53663 [Myriangium duriaei CBS 260.36]|uniref:VOC domain-containing protein n=1 Tax=Myriangium duriaei CBS 260.36 TaxID=1168546 RepID=A0A9P4IRT1_9PEZI|nr:hypothetical protein K461DRAFT_53663 [Myriangium duriaei CBS 260.36]
MPVSHVGLSVENIGPLSSFYASALQPLGYRYIGEREGQLGFGVNEADFFISPILPSTTRPAPIHVAFQAADTSEVRSFYACAVNAGGRPAGPPSWRGQVDQIFNAAVHDLEGNTVEVVYHPKAQAPAQAAPQAASQYQPDYRHTQVNHVTSPTRYAESPLHYTSPPSHHTPSAARSQTAKSQSTKSRSAKSQSSQSRASSDTSSEETAVTQHDSTSTQSSKPHEEKVPSKKLVGTLIGAAASAAALCAMFGMERDSSRKERAFSDDMTSHKRHRRSSRRDDESDAPSKQSFGRARTFYDVDDHTSTVQPRGTTYEAIEAAPPSSYRPSSRRDSMFSAGSKGSKSGRPVDRASFRDPFLPETVDQVTIRYRRRSSSLPPRDVSPHARSRPIDIPSQAATSTRSRPRTSSQTPSRQTQSRPPPSTRSSRTARPGNYPSAAAIPLPASHTSRATAKSTAKSTHSRMLDPDTPRTAPLDVITKSFGGRSRSSRNRLFDVDTVVPDDSISCVSSNRPTQPRRWDGNGGSVRTVPQSRRSGRGGGGREYRERDREGKRKGRERASERSWAGY